MYAWSPSLCVREFPLEPNKQADLSAKKTLRW